MTDDKELITAIAEHLVEDIGVPFYVEECASLTARLARLEEIYGRRVVRAAWRIARAQWRGAYMPRGLRTM
jgi:hypothetical protein